MAFIPIYYAESFLAMFQGQNNAVKQSTYQLTASANNVDLGVDTIAGSEYNTYVENTNPTGGPYRGMYPSIYRINCTAASNITGIVAPTVTAQKMTPMIIQNTGTATITLVNASASSSPANRINCVGGSNLTIAAGAYRVIFYETAVTTWTAGRSMYSGGFGVAVPATDGVIVLLDAAFWDAWHTGNYDSAGNKTANTNDVFYAYGYTAPTPTTYTTNTEGNSTAVIQANISKVVQCKRELPGMTLLSKSGTVFVQFSKNEQGQGFNRQGN